MYIIGGNCDYCKQHCSRDPQGDGLLLHTPEIPFIREVVCDTCWQKIITYLDRAIDITILGNERK